MNNSTRHKKLRYRVDLHTLYSSKKILYIVRAKKLGDLNEVIFIIVFKQDHTYVYLFIGEFILLSLESNCALYKLANGSSHS